MWVGVGMTPGVGDDHDRTRIGYISFFFFEK
jgi:hypothetical protein